jgi:hypothetical protein
METHPFPEWNAKEYRTFEFQVEGFSRNAKLLERAASFRMADHP